MNPRYYLTDIVGTGEADVDEYRAALMDYGVSVQAGFPCDTETGAPLRDWTLAIVKADDHAPMIADARADVLPDYPLDGKVSGISSVAKAAMLAAMERRGIDTSEVDGTDAYREVIRAIGNAANATTAAFNENSFSV